MAAVTQLKRIFFVTYNFRSSLNVFEIAKIDDVGKSCNEN